MLLHWLTRHLRSGGGRWWWLVTVDAPSLVKRVTVLKAIGIRPIAVMLASDIAPVSLHIDQEGSEATRCTCSAARVQRAAPLHSTAAVCAFSTPLQCSTRAAPREYRCTPVVCAQHATVQRSRRACT